MIILANTFFSRFPKLQSKEIRQCMAFVDKFQRDPASPGISLERINGARDPNMWSGRITQDLRAILNKIGDTWAFLYADHHDAAYRWGETKRVEYNDLTGALQIITPTERVEEIISRQGPLGASNLFADHADDYLLSLGVPPEWLPTLRKIESDEVLLEAAEDLPEEVAERLISLVDGKVVTPPSPQKSGDKITGNLDSMRRFYVVEDDEDFQSVLHEPMAAWIAFLHPSQREIAYGEADGPTMVTGGAGTGKTVVALHRARHLARQGNEVLLTSFVTTLCHNLEHQLSLFCTEEELKRIKVSTLHAVARRLVRSKVKPVGAQTVHERIDEFNQLYPSGFENAFLHHEWDHVIEEQAIRDWDSYRSADRSGLSHPLTVAERKQVWEIFQRVFESLNQRGQITWPGLCAEAARLLDSGKVQSPFHAVVVDETQDLGAQELTLVAALGRRCAPPDGLMLVGDGGQRIYSRGFCLHDFGIDTRGRSHKLHINYRTTAEIRRQADRVRSTNSDPMEEGTLSVRGTRNLLHGPEPVFRAFEGGEEQADFVAHEISQRLEEGLRPEAMAVFSRTRNSLGQVQRALEKRRIGSVQLEDQPIDRQEHESIKLGTMHRAKGLEFQVVFVIDASHSLLPNPAAYRSVQDEILRQQAIERERNLVYVSLTRPRDELFVTWSGQPSSFLSEALAALQP